MSEFMTRGVAASTEGGPPAEGNIFAGSQWGGPDSWDGPVWSEKYKKYITKKDQEFDDAAEQIAKRHAQQHDDELHRAECPCSVPSHHASYIQDIKRRIEPVVETIHALEQQIAHLGKHITEGDGDAKEVGESSKAAEETIGKLKTHVHDVAQKLHAIIKNAEKSTKKLDEGEKVQAPK